MTHMHRLGDVARRKAQEEALVDDEPADLRMVGGRHFDRSPGTLCRCDPLDPLDPRVLQDPPDPRVREGPLDENDCSYRARLKVRSSAVAGRGRGWSSPRSERQARSEEKWLASLKSPDWQGCLLLHNARANHADRCSPHLRHQLILHRWPAADSFHFVVEQARGNKQPHGGSRGHGSTRRPWSGARKTREAATRLPIARMRWQLVVAAGY